MEKLRVFISSKMAELRDVREIIAKALDDKGIDAWVYEAYAGARPEDVVETSLSELEAADIYMGLFWEKHGEVTVQEYRHARALDKPCFVYIRYKDIQREKALEDFLEDEVYDLQKGVTYDYFDSAIELGEQVADNIMAWLVRRHREMTAEIREARVSQDEIARLQTEVNRLQAASCESLPQGTPADYLAQQMRAWFETLGYHFEGHDVRAEDYFEWIINVPARRGYDRILVRGIEGEAEMSDIAALRQAVDEQRTDEGWLVTARRKSQAACDEVEKKGNRDLFCYTFDELLDEHADFSGYLDWLEDEVKRQGIDTMYVPLACTKEEFNPVTKRKIGESRYDELNGWIDGYIDRWLDDPSKEHISILGEFGTGKTWFALHYAWTAVQRYREAKERGVERPRLPLVIPLRDYAKAVSVESLFSEFFFRKHEIPLPGYSAFEQLNRMGKLLLIFDGFDEMAARVDRQKMINNFWELGRVVVPGAKAILTCRTEHFPEAQEGRALLSAELQASTAALTGESPQFEVLELEKFDDVQIRQVLSLRAKPAKVEQVMDNPDLLDLARRPVMTEFILEALPDIEAGKPVDFSRVYLYAVRHKMERDIGAKRTFTSLADKLYFLCELSWEMLSTNQMSLNYRLFPDRLRRLFGPVVQEQKDLDHWHHDMMGQTMLIRNADGDYSPAHRSLLEFFVAYKLAAELGVLAPDFIEPARAQSHLDASAPPQDYTWSSYFQREIDEKGAVKLIPPLDGFVAEEMDILAETVGRMPLTEAILYLTLNLLSPDEKTVRERLWNVIEATRDLSVEEVGYAGGNAATVLNQKQPSFQNKDLSNCILVGADLSGADLTGADFAGTDISEGNLERADLNHARLAGIKGCKNTSFTDAYGLSLQTYRQLRRKGATTSRYSGKFAPYWAGDQIRHYRGDFEEASSLFIERILAFCNSGDLVCDLMGGGGGVPRQLLEEMPLKIDLADISEDMLAQIDPKIFPTITKLRVDFRDTDVHLPHEGKYKALICKKALHELPLEHQAVLAKRMFSWLAPGGRLFLWEDGVNYRISQRFQRVILGAKKFDRIDEILSVEIPQSREGSGLWLNLMVLAKDWTSGNFEECENRYFPSQPECVSYLKEAGFRVVRPPFEFHNQFDPITTNERALRATNQDCEKAFETNEFRVYCEFYKRHLFDENGHRTLLGELFEAELQMVTDIEQRNRIPVGTVKGIRQVVQIKVPSFIIEAEKSYV